MDTSSQMLLIEPPPESAGDLQVRQIVELAGPGIRECDRRFPRPEHDTAVTPRTYLTWPASPRWSIGPKSQAALIL